MSISHGSTLEAALRRVFQRFNHFMLLLWRLGLGPSLSAWPEVGGRILVVTHTGRKSGLRRRTPLNYAEVGGDIYLVAGFGAIADWYKNVRHNPHVEIWMPDGWWEGVAEEADDRPDRLALLREVLRGSGIVAPLFGVSPDLPDARLAELTAAYRLVRIRRGAPRTGVDGPGDLTWTWSYIIAAALVVGWIAGRARRDARA